MVGGTVGVICFLTFFTGTEVGLQGYQALDQIGSSAFTGFISAYFNTREISPLVAALALSATVGCGFTAQLGAMRISEEVDALEVMGKQYDEAEQVDGKGTTSLARRRQAAPRLRRGR